MNCYECPKPEPAVAVCHFCGAGLCRGHVRSQPDEVHELTGTGPTYTASGRRMTCAVCAMAQQVVSDTQSY